MKNYVLFEDGEQRIEIDGKFHELLKSTQVKDFRLSETAWTTVSTLAIDLFKGMKLSPHNLTIAGNIPIIERGGAMTRLQEPFDVFNDIIMELEERDILDQADLQRNEKELNQMFNSDNLYIKLLPRRLYDVKGTILWQTEEKGALILFGYENSTAGLLFDEDF